MTFGDGFLKTFRKYYKLKYTNYDGRIQCLGRKHTIPIIRDHVPKILMGVATRATSGTSQWQKAEIQLQIITINHSCFTEK